LPADGAPGQPLDPAAITVDISPSVKGPDQHPHATGAQPLTTSRGPHGFERTVTFAINALGVDKNNCRPPFKKPRFLSDR
jgi:hypothetical protein